MRRIGTFPVIASDVLEHTDRRMLACLVSDNFSEGANLIIDSKAQHGLPLSMSCTALR